MFLGCLTLKIDSVVITYTIYLLTILLYLTDIKKSYKFLIIYLIFIIYIIIAYKLEKNLLENFNIFYVYDVKQNYSLLSKGTQRYLIWIGGSEISIGEYIKLEGGFEKLSNNGNFWDFNFNDYLNDKNVKFVINDLVWQKYDFKGLRYFFYNLSIRQNKLVDLLLFQIKTDNPVYLLMNQLGNGYLINISGFYLFPLSWFIQKYVFKHNKTYIKWKIILIILLFFYCYLLRFPVVMLKVNFYLLIRWFEQNYHLKLKKYSRLSIIWICILIINPLYIFSPGFIYSLIAVISLKQFQNNRTLIKILKNFLLLNLVFIPLQMYFDYRIYWLLEIFKIFIFPILFLSYLLIMITIILPFLISFLDILYNCLKYLLLFLNQINISTRTGYIGIVFIILYYSMLNIFIRIIFINYIKEIFFILIMLCSLFTSIAFHKISNFNPSIVMLNGGNGNSFVLNYKNQYFILDAGVGTGHNKNTLKNYLNYYGVNQINTIFISHNHVDHSNMLDDVINTFEVKQVIENRDLITHLQIAELSFDIFYELNNKDENDNSQVIIITYLEDKFLFMGDSSKAREARLLNNRQFRKLIGEGIDFLQVGHHGSKTSSGAKFIEFLNPKTCFISAENRKNRRFPNFQTLETLKKYQCNTYISDSKYNFKYNINSKRVINIKKEFF
ncbi:DNA uptake protein [Spiroplasma culicicola AES-1]|uniref:DNA uptake protein n=1 Tax=Spiroplasma culicicola AES-1 TaxID=1276246 RepID=W6A712_9MOLU|nr:DNA uptake protein [Spiroplasma culicicola AES-1]